jgi:ammonia channel protein AmtB
MIAEDLERSASSYPEPRMTSDNRHVKATTELTSKSIKATMLLFGLAFAACVIGAITQDEPVSAYCIFGALLSALGYLITKIARWWENE